MRSDKLSDTWTPNKQVYELCGVYTEMSHYGAERYFTSAQASHMAKLKQKLDAIRRLAEADYDPTPIRSGLQMGFIMFDIRTGYWREQCALLFDVGKENRYRHMINMEKQNGLIGWSDAVRQAEKKINRPLLKT